MANIFELNVNITSTVKSEAQQALDETTNGGVGTVPTLEGADTPVKGGEEAASNASSTGGAIGALALQTVGKAASDLLSFDISRTATVFGDQARANEISNLMAGTGIVGNIAQGALTGLAVGGPWGALAGAILATVTEGVKVAQRAYEFNIKQTDHKINANYAQERLGILTVSKGR